MKAVCTVILAVALLPPPAQAKGMICFTKSEQNAEQLVRSGIRLREGAVGCDGPPWHAATLPLWQQVDQRYGSRFKQQTELRRQAFVREFAGDAENHEQMWDGRIVFYYRNYSLSTGYCREIKQTLETIVGGGWGLFVKQAHTAQDAVEMDYRVCR